MKVDLLKGRPARSILVFSLPILFGNLLQQLYNTVDTLVVGRVVGSDALAAVGLCAPIIFLVLGVSWGLSDSSSILIGQTVGDRGQGGIKPIAYTSLIYSSVLSVVISALCYLLAEEMLVLIRTPEELLATSTEYLRIYFLGLFFVYGFNMLSSTFRAMGDSSTPLIFLAVASVVNVVLDIVFVAVFSWGVAGAAWATVIAQAVAFLLELAVLVKRINRLPGRTFDPAALKVLVRLAVPSTSQQVLISLGNIFTQSIINTFGADVLAGYTATYKMVDFIMLPMIAMGSAATVFCAQNMGAMELGRIKQGYRSVMAMLQGFAAVSAVVVLVFRRSFVGFFLGDNINQVILDSGVSYLIFSAFSFFFMALVFCSECFLRGAGDLLAFLFTAVTGAAVKILLALLLMGSMGYTGVWLAIAVGWLTEGILTTGRYLSGRWKTKRVV